ncbi:hypothetical protein V490_01776 [Pseudogymnoascus sp. VKM F-3557]|nr:hypothetical protein V490_01776 [Pseudogymnoascus sp. VKM F-3557]
MSQLGRSAQACIICHKKKVKCDLASGKQPCTNCEIGDLRCRPHQRKRKHYSISPSPPPPPTDPQARGFSQSILETQDQGQIQPETQNDTWEARTPLVSRQTYTRETPARVPTPVTRSERSVHTIISGHPPQETINSHHTPSGESYLGRSEYLGGNIPFNESMAIEAAPAKSTGLSEIDLQILHLHKAFDLPPRATRESLIDKYMELCSPWTPIVERCWLEETEGSQPSLLLLQAVLLAGSRVTSNTLVYASSQEFYQKARALFFSGHEKNIMFSIISLCLLQWWNPTGPEQISTDTSGFWVRIAVGMAYQVGLHREPSGANRKDRMDRRRLWWSLVCRDCIISVGVGRPRTINLEDSDVAPPSVEDFPVQDSKARLFVAFVSICQLLGDVTQCYRRKSLTPSRRQDLENALYRWIKELPAEFHILQKGRKDPIGSYNFEARQLLVPYFVILVILNRGPVAGSVPSTVSLVASSFIASIYEEFIARDELRHLGPAFAFYALAAGLSQLSGYRYRSLANAAEENFKIIRLSLELLSKRWGSSNGALRALPEARKAVLRLPLYSEPPACIPTKSLLFFNDFDSSLCNMGHLCDMRAGVADYETENIGGGQFPATATGSVVAGLQQREQLGVQAEQLPAIDMLEGTSQNLFPASPSAFPLFMDGGYGYQQLESFWGSADPVGSWLLDDFHR